MRKGTRLTEVAEDIPLRAEGYYTSAIALAFRWTSKATLLCISAVMLPRGANKQTRQSDDL
jgi:hypothetical protein